MTNLSNTEVARLRKRAESHLGRLIEHTIPDLAPHDVQALVHELRVHQIELEMQCQEVQRAHAEVEEGRTRYRELYESIPVGYVTIDAGGRIYDMNPTAASLLALPEKDILPTNLFSFFSADETDALTLFVRNVISQQAPNSCELKMTKVGGSGFAASLQAAPVQVGEGKGERIRISFRDITRRKETEELLRQHEVELQDLMGKLFTAQEEERRRIACELHDDHCQRITALILEASSLANLFKMTMPSLVPRMESWRDKLSDILDDFRHLSHELHPRYLDTVSLACSMHTHIKEVSDYADFRVEFDEQDAPARLPMPIIICLYRLLQETLGNIRKHANATYVKVRLSGGPDEVELLVTDDGTGFDFSRLEEGKKGLGLTSMKERVRPLHGRVNIESKPGLGTTVTVTIPVPCAT